jgi:hypothetical protein
MKPYDTFGPALLVGQAWSCGIAVAVTVTVAVAMVGDVAVAIVLWVLVLCRFLVLVYS